MSFPPDWIATQVQPGDGLTAAVTGHRGLRSSENQLLPHLGVVNCGQGHTCHPNASWHCPGIRGPQAASGAPEGSAEWGSLHSPGPGEIDRSFPWSPMGPSGRKQEVISSPQRRDAAGGQGCPAATFPTVLKRNNEHIWQQRVFESNTETRLLVPFHWYFGAVV